MAYNMFAKLERKGNGIKVEDAITFFRDLEQLKVSSGVHSDEGSEYIKRAAHTEFGTTRFAPWNTPFGMVYVVPPRPAIRMGLYPEMRKEITDTYIKNINAQKKSKLKKPGNNALSVQEEVGIKAQYLQQEKMRKGGYSLEGNTTNLDPEHNGVRTVAYKGFDDPWIGKTGETIEHVNYKVTRK